MGVAVIVILVLVALAIPLTIWALIAAEFEKIAKDKGYPQGKYFWLPFVFGIPGMLLVLALPDKNSTDRLSRLIENINKNITK